MSAWFYELLADAYQDRKVRWRTTDAICFQSARVAPPRPLVRVALRGQQVVISCYGGGLQFVDGWEIDLGDPTLFDVLEEAMRIRSITANNTSRSNGVTP